jgi:cell shape-determining protein MreC
VPLVKAVQELSAENKELKKEVNELQQKQEQIEVLEARLAKLEAALSRSTHSSNTTATITGAYLEQSIPNPSRGSALIRYHLPQGTSSAQVVVTNSKGQVLKTIALNSRGDGQVSLQGGNLPAGTYTYSLWIEGRQADTKQMVIVR